WSCGGRQVARGCEGGGGEVWTGCRVCVFVQPGRFAKRGCGGRAGRHSVGRVADGLHSPYRQHSLGIRVL
ncbi:hypothetical protein LPJ69_006595, partial [Coemansia sp. RSA 1752]